MVHEARLHGCEQVAECGCGSHAVGWELGVEGGVVVGEVARVLGCWRSE